MSQRYGRSAQDHFKLLCSQQSITCNPAQEQDFGWDYILDVPPKNNDCVAADTTPPIRQALVQIKSTTSKYPCVTLKLSNALYLSKFQLPSFVVLFHNPKPAGTSQIFATHFWKDLIERSLKRARLTSVEGIEPHKKRMTIRFSDNDEHSDDLIAWIVSTVHSLPTDYTNAKNTLHETLGYENHGFRGKTTIDLTRGIEDLLDHQLGLTESLPVSYIKLTGARFGIEAPNPVLEATSGNIRIAPNPIQGFRVLMRSACGQTMVVPCTLTAPAIPGLSTTLLKFHLRSWIFDAILSTNKRMKLTLNLSMDDCIPLSKLVELAKFLSWHGKQIDLKLIRKDSEVLAANLSMPASAFMDRFSRLSQYATTLCRVLQNAGSDERSFSMLELDASHQRLFVFNTVVTEEPVQVRLELDEPVSGIFGLNYAMGFINTNVGKVHFFVTFRVEVAIAYDDDREITLDFGKRTWLDCIVGENVNIAREECIRRYKRLVAITGDNFVALDDLNTSIPLP